MKNFFFNLLKSPKYDDYETNLKARIVHASLLVSIPASLMLILVNSSVITIWVVWLLLLLSFSCFLGLVFFQSIPFDMTAGGLCSLLWILMTYNLFDNGASLHTQGVAAFPILILFAGFLFDWEWATLLATAMSVVAVGMVYGNSLLELFPINPKTPPDMGNFLTLAVLYIVFGIVAFVIRTAWKTMLSNIRTSYESSLKEINERKRVEAEIQALNATLEHRVLERTKHLDSLNRQLESFSYSVSHDLRAPLRAVSGYCRILKEDFFSLLPHDGQTALNRIDANIHQMNELIEALLQFSRLGRQGVVKKWVPPREIIDEVIRDLKYETAEREVEFIFDPLPECEADPALLKQVWLNLISNALKYSRRRDLVRIKIGSMTVNEIPDTVYFIQDNGVGFNMQYAKKMFGVFQRLHPAEDYEGTGVGLAIVENIVENHGGRIWAESEVDRGATFYFTLTSS